MKISNTIQHYKKRVRRKFWPSKCLKSRHNLWFLLHSNVSKCPLHLLIIHPSSKFLLITYLIFQGLFIFILHVLRNADVRAAYFRKKKNWKAARSIGTSHSANHDSIALGSSDTRSEGQDSRSKCYSTSPRSVIGYDKPVAFDQDRCMTPVNTWMSLIRRSYPLDSKWNNDIIKLRYYSVTPEFSRRLKLFVICYACLLVLLEMHSRAKK